MTVERPAVVEHLHRAGFHFGPDASQTCTRCPHRWGDHLLYPIFPDNPLAGGTLSCPADGCLCLGTWGVAIPEWTTGVCGDCGVLTEFGRDPLPHICLDCLQLLRESDDTQEDQHDEPD